MKFDQIYDTVRFCFLGAFTVKVPKKTPGEVFPDLNLITKLLTPSCSASANPLIEELGDNDNGEGT